MQKLFPAAVPVSKKLEVLSLLSQSLCMLTDRRLVAIHGSMRAFWGHPCPQILVPGQKAKNFWLFSEVTAAGKSFCIRLDFTAVKVVLELIAEFEKLKWRSLPKSLSLKHKCHYLCQNQPL